jgi:hypothetical protein
LKTCCKVKEVSLKVKGFFRGYEVIKKVMGLKKIVISLENGR